MNRYTLSLTLLALSSAASAQELKERAVFRGHTREVYLAALSADGKLFASTPGDSRVGELKLWDAVTGKEITSLPVTGSQESFYALAFSPDGRHLACAGIGPLQVWDTQTRKRIWRHEENGEQVYRVAFSSDGKKVASATHSGAFVWDALTGKELSALKHRHPAFESVGFFSPDLTTLAMPNFQEIDLWDIATGKLRSTLREHSGQVRHVGWSNDGKTLIGASSTYRATYKYKGDLKLWDPATGKERLAFRQPLGSVIGSALSPDGRILAVLDSPEVNSQNYTLKVLDIAGGTDLSVKSPAGQLLLSSSFVDGKLFVIGSTTDRRTLTLWEVALRKDR